MALPGHGSFFAFQDSVVPARQLTVFCWQNLDIHGRTSLDVLRNTKII